MPEYSPERARPFVRGACPRPRLAKRVLTAEGPFTSVRSPLAGGSAKRPRMGYPIDVALARFLEPGSLAAPGQSVAGLVNSMPGPKHVSKEIS